MNESDRARLVDIRYLKRRKPKVEHLYQRIRALEAYATSLEDGNRELIAKIAVLEQALEEIIKAKGV